MAKKASKKKSVSSKPDAFHMICDDEFPPTWDFTKDKGLVGAILLMKTTTVMRNQKLEDVDIMVVSVEGKKYSVWESAGLKDAFNGAEVGDAIWIEYTKDIPLAGRPKPMRGFKAAIDKGNGDAYK